MTNPTESNDQRPVVAVMAHQLENSANPLTSIHDTIAFSSADWGEARDLAWIYGIVCGWDSEEEDEEGAMDEVSARFGWSPERVARLRRLHAAWATMEPGEGSQA